MAYTTIDKPTDYFNTKLYTGTGSELSLTGVNFQPDLTWIKNRDTTDSHQLVDSVRGATKNLFSNLTNAEATDAQGLKSFDTDGFTVGTRLGMNTSGESYVGWNWLASNTTASNTDGDITSSVSVNTTAGFSIVTYTGDGASSATIGHGLGSAPAVLINKTRSLVGYDWNVQHKSLGATKYLYLSSTAAEATNIGMWNNTAPTSSVFTVGTYDNVNKASETYVTYCFSEVKGYSKFGNYTGNGNADGTFIYTGFKPSFVLQKKTSGTSDWVIYDNKRDVSNVVTQELKPNSSGAENSFTNIDILSNGFKQRANYAYTNNSGGTYIYMAFAENPFVTSSGVPTTAR